MELGTLYYCKLVLHNLPADVSEALDWLVRYGPQSSAKRSAAPTVNHPFWRLPLRDRVCQYALADLPAAPSCAAAQEWINEVMALVPPRLLASQDGPTVLALASHAFDLGQNRMLLDWLRPYLDPAPHQVAVRYTRIVNTWYSVLSTGEHLPYLRSGNA